VRYGGFSTGQSLRRLVAGGIEINLMERIDDMKLLVNNHVVIQVFSVQGRAPGL
jgi:hypothetical protein